MDFEQKQDTPEPCEQPRQQQVAPEKPLGAYSVSRETTRIRAQADVLVAWRGDGCREVKRFRVVDEDNSPGMHSTPRMVIYFANTPMPHGSLSVRMAAIAGTYRYRTVWGRRAKSRERRCHFLAVPKPDTLSMRCTRQGGR